MARLHFWNAGHKPANLAEGDYGFSTRGLLDDRGWHPPEEAAQAFIDLPDAEVLAGSYADVLHALSRNPHRGHSSSCAIVIAGENNREFEAFLAALADHGVAEGYAGGVAAYPEGSSRGELLPAGAECILVLTRGRTETRNLHQVVSSSLAVVTENERSFVTMEGMPAAEYYRQRRADTYPAGDYEHLTLSDAEGRNIHLAPDPEEPGRLRAGAAFPSGTAQLREVPRIVDPLEEAVRGTSLAFCCAGLGGAIERAPAAEGTVCVWMYGEVVDPGSGPRLGNLMISTWSSKK